MSNSLKESNHEIVEFIKLCESPSELFELLDSFDGYFKMIPKHAFDNLLVQSFDQPVEFVDTSNLNSDPIIELDLMISDLILDEHKYVKAHLSGDDLNNELLVEEILGEQRGFPYIYPNFNMHPYNDFYLSVTGFKYFKFNELIFLILDRNKNLKNCVDLFYVIRGIYKLQYRLKSEELFDTLLEGSFDSDSNMYKKFKSQL